MLDKDIKKNESADNFVLRLFVAGASANSARAISNIRSICELYLKNRYELEIVDVYQQPLLAQQEQLIALPLLIKKNPLPERRMFGDMSDLKKVLKGLGINEVI
ncbi:KaiB [Arcticibacter svalbardensis MN12-7]|uniref:KaiB n=1 Tax=Arcticibacter svalbardensis MN12-7 TaxID=1150600 RepID=R9GNZ9_9SPHI|nr:circadian clock KaiB family protein [Arcticibacter svalbardensis]EOR93441.1 KaiB [Arcticibacter svalbardensis MN12-7]